VGRDEHRLSRAEVERRWGVPSHRSIEAMLGAGAPLAVVTSVPWAATPVVVRELVARDMAVLAETPPAPDAEGLRALVKHLDEIGDEEIAGLNIPTGIPLLYELDESLTPTVRGGRYLDPEAAATAAAAVASQGR